MSKKKSIVLLVHARLLLPSSSPQTNHFTAKPGFKRRQTLTDRHTAVDVKRCSASMRGIVVLHDDATRAHDGIGGTRERWRQTEKRTWRISTKRSPCVAGNPCANARQGYLITPHPNQGLLYNYHIMSCCSRT